MKKRTKTKMTMRKKSILTILSILIVAVAAVEVRKTGYFYQRELRRQALVELKMLGWARDGDEVLMPVVTSYEDDTRFLYGLDRFRGPHLKSHLEDIFAKGKTRRRILSDTFNARFVDIVNGTLLQQSLPPCNEGWLTGPGPRWQGCLIMPVLENEAVIFILRDGAEIF